MRALLFIMALLLSHVSAGAQQNEPQRRDRGFLDEPPVYVVGEPDIALAGFGAFVPRPGETVPAFESVTIESDEWRNSGVAVQQDLFLKMSTLRLGALHGLNGGWAVGAILPRTRTLVGNDIGGNPATSVRTGFGDVLFAGKKILWRGEGNQQLVGAAGIELPTGLNDVHFDQNNSSTDAYYPTDPGRLPISWQPAPGTTNGIFSISYARYVGRWSYAGMLVTKLFGRGFADSKIANISVVSTCASYGIARWCAASLGLTWRLQGDDSYPGVNPSVASKPALVATTTHGNVLYLDPSMTFLVAKRLVVGVDARYPISKPSNGMVPSVRVDAIFYPTF